MTVFVMPAVVLHFVHKRRKDIEFLSDIIFANKIDLLNVIMQHVPMP